MKNWTIATDSSCDLKENDFTYKNINYERVPFAISIDDKEYMDSNNLNIDELLEHMEKSQVATHTSCPSPLSWYDIFLKCENTVAITISSNLSGSFSSAMAAKEMIEEQFPEKNILILDSLTAGSAISLLVDKTAELIEKGLSFDDLARQLLHYRKQCHTIFALCSFNNLVKNGRISKIAGFIAGRLGLSGIGVGSSDGKIVFKEKTRGQSKLISKFLDQMKENGFSGGKVVISHCQNPELAKALAEQIRNTWSNAKIVLLSTGGLCSYYAEKKGLILGF